MKTKKNKEKNQKKAEVSEEAKGPIPTIYIKNKDSWDMPAWSAFQQSVPLGLAYSLSEDNWYIIGRSEVLNKTEVMKYLKGIFINTSRFKSRFLDPWVNKIREENAKDDEVNRILEGYTEEMEQMIVDFENVTPFSYEEAFKVEIDQFKILVFNTINIPEMFEKLEAKRIAVDGHHFKDKVFSETGEHIGYKEYDSVYEVYEAKGDKLGLEGQFLYAVKCWCTSTDKSAMIFIEDQYKNDPKAAIASTFHIYEKLVPYVKEFKRQGDVFIVELTQKVDIDDPKKEPIISLTKELYFGKLTSQT